MAQQRPYVCRHTDLTSSNDRLGLIGAFAFMHQAYSSPLSAIIPWLKNIECGRTRISIYIHQLPFDLLAFSLTLYSSLSRPRPGDVGATSVVRQDGACFFCVSGLLTLTCCLLVLTWIFCLIKIKTCLDALNTWFAAFGDSHKIMTVTAYVSDLSTYSLEHFTLTFNF